VSRGREPRCGRRPRLTPCRLRAQSPGRNRSQALSAPQESAYLHRKNERQRLRPRASFGRRRLPVRILHPGCTGGFGVALHDQLGVRHAVVKSRHAAASNDLRASCQHRPSADASDNSASSAGQPLRCLLWFPCRFRKVRPCPLAMLPTDLAQPSGHPLRGQGSRFRQSYSPEPGVLPHVARTTSAGTVHLF